MRERTALGILARGIAAGVVGTTCMTALQEATGRLRHSMTVNADAMSDGEVDPWSKAPAPAQLAKRVIESVSGRELSRRRVPLLTNAVHWGYGTALGGLYAVVQGALPQGARGPLFGLGVWAQSYATLVPLGLYEWPWHYPAKTIAKDVSYHLVYGTGTAAGYRLLERAAGR
jgi:hypothetical protein